MPRFETAHDFPFAVAPLFAFLLRPANRMALALPALHLQLLEGPEVLALGARVRLSARRWGLSREMLSEVTVFEVDALIVEEQRTGPFRAWTHTQRFAGLAEGRARLVDAIDYEPPGGMLGLILSAAAIKRELTASFAHRDRRLIELLGG